MASSDALSRPRVGGGNGITLCGEVTGRASVRRAGDLT